MSPPRAVGSVPLSAEEVMLTLRTFPVALHVTPNQKEPQGSPPPDQLDSRAAFWGYLTTWRWGRGGPCLSSAKGKKRGEGERGEGNRGECEGEYESE